MSLNKVLSVITRGKVDFCCLCSHETVSSQNGIHDEVIIDIQDTQTMSGLLDLMLGEDMKTTASEFGVFCNECKVSLVNSYKFRKMCRNNLNNLLSAVDLVTESFENVLPDLESYKTLFVTIDLKDFTSKQFYDNTYFGNVIKAKRRLSSILKPPIKIEKKENKELTLLTKKVIRGYGETAPRKHSMVYDIPSIPTTFILENKNDPTNYTCRICLTAFKMEEKLRRHYFKKHHPRLVKCRKCPLKFISKEMLRQHEEDNHSVEICNQCGKSFTSKYVFKKHMMNHDLQIICNDCGRVYRSTEAFKKHVNDDVCSQKSKKSADQAVFECDHCKKRYNYKHYLSKHIMHEHGNVEGFRCGFCNKQFYTQSRLKTHLLKHTHEKKFVCEICNGRFVTRESLTYHTRLHTGEKPYQCDYCDEAFVSASRRLDHMRRHHLKPSLECNICHTKFKATGSLLKHKKRHFNPNSRLNIVRQSYTTLINTTSDALKSKEIK